MHDFLSELVVLVQSGIAITLEVNNLIYPIALANKKLAGAIFRVPGYQTVHLQISDFTNIRNDVCLHVWPQKLPIELIVA